MSEHCPVSIAEIEHDRLTNNRALSEEEVEAKNAWRLERNNFKIRILDGQLVGVRHKEGCFYDLIDVLDYLDNETYEELRDKFNNEFDDLLHTYNNGGLLDYQCAIEIAAGKLADTVFGL